MRTDIQALRGLAVGYVLFYHAGIGGVQAGFLGVDIFFVISGFLITGIVRDALAAGTFSFRQFYLRRARRLLPAACVVMAGCAALSGWLLMGPQQAAFHAQLLGALGFVVNFVLLAQVDYFAPEADLSPLLHMWSLAVEEQYYAVLPVMLFLLPRRWWGPAAITVVAGSLAACLALLPHAPATAFYMLPTRAWELGLGSLGALYAARLTAAPWIGRLSLPAVAVLVLVPFFPTGLPHPGVDALLVCVATLVLLLRREDTHWLPVRMLGRIGDMSYSLYLVHWPLFAFAGNVYLSSTIPADVRVGLLGLSLVLGWALWRGIEQPLRRREVVLTPRLALRVAGVTAAIALLPWASAALWPAQSGHDRAPNWGFARACVADAPFDARPECRNAPADAVEIIVWGDSFAMHLVPGLATSGAPVEQATTEACGPLLGLAPRNDASYTRPWAEFCLRFSQSVLAHIRQSPAEIVVLSTSAAQYVEASARVLVMGPDGLAERNGSVDLALERLRATADAIRAAGKRVVLVSAPPRAPYDLPGCLERKATGRPVLGHFAGCPLSMDLYRFGTPATVQFFERLEAEGGLPVIRLDDALCTGATCLTMVDGLPVYGDRLHLSASGSAALARRMSWLDRIRAEAR